MCVRDKIKVLACVRGLKMDEVVKASGMDKSTFYNKTKGLRDWKLSDIQRLCKILRCPATELFDGLDGSN